MPEGLEPLYTAAEMKAAEAGHDVDELMARAGRVVAEEAMRRFPDARRFVAVCGKGANGGDGRIAVDVIAAAGRARTPRAGSTRSTRPECRWSRSTCPPAWTPRRARSPAPASTRR